MRRLAIVLGLALGGCSLFHRDYPGDACETAADCFQGEECVNKKCVPRVVIDAAPPPPDAPPGSPDAPPPPDAAPVDAAPPDGTP